MNLWQTNSIRLKLDICWLGLVGLKEKKLLIFIEFSLKVNLYFFKQDDTDSSSYQFGL